MIDVQEVIALLKSGTGYLNIELIRKQVPDLIELADLPAIFVGYATIDSKNPNAPIEHDIYNTHGEDLVQTFEVQIVCNDIDLPTIWKKLYTALIGVNPNPAEVDHSGFTYGQGGVIGIANGRLAWLDRWRIGFPTSNPTF